MKGEKRKGKKEGADLSFPPGVNKNKSFCGGRKKERKLLLIHQLGQKRKRKERESQDALLATLFFSSVALEKKREKRGG